ncbi:hypothetical protein ONE63_001445 [Megalurothrips usitatus]|uniref:Uncharacterized protein n=1 Tax=Megalurothrips usitatus TaxID=439358 RepID=A0AAV7XJ02_9NEOP|nr:hypothetical protein ONE63_001445 [Megalurothrips usitatus]
MRPFSTRRGQRRLKTSTSPGKRWPRLSLPLRSSSLPDVSLRACQAGPVSVVGPTVTSLKARN